MSGFRYVSFAQEVIFSSGALARLGEALQRFGWQRLILCTSHSMRANGCVDAIKSVIGDRLVAAFDRVQPHVQDIQVDEVLALAVEHDVQAVIGMGGGSPIGMAKAVAFALEEKRARAASPTEQPLIPVVAIPTTYAGSEMTAVYGITHTRENPPRKITASDPKIAPKLIIYDPELTLDLPPEMTASTGINALAHCIEALYSITNHPASTAVAIRGIYHINRGLFASFHDGKNVEARTDMLTGAHLAGLSLASVTMGLHHGLCHVLGGTANIPHGIVNSIILPHAIRFNAEVTADQLLPAVQAFGISTNGLSPVMAVEVLAEKVFELVREMKLPGRLRDGSVALKEADLPQLAHLAFQNRTVQNNPKPITEPAQIEALLRAAW